MVPRRPLTAQMHGLPRGTAPIEPTKDVGYLWETYCNTMRNTEQNEQMEWRPSVRAIMFKLPIRLLSMKH